MTFFFVLVTILAISPITFVIFACCECSTRTATSLTLRYGFLPYFVVIIETRLTSKVSVPFVTGDSNTIERTRRARHSVATLMVTSVRHVSSTTFVARFTDVPFVIT